MNPKQKLTPQEILNIVNAYTGPNFIKEALDKEALAIKKAKCPTCYKQDLKKGTLGTHNKDGEVLPVFGEVLPVFNLYCENCDKEFTTVEASI